MGLLDKLKAALGLESRERSRGEGTTVTVEYDPEEPDVESEAVAEGIEEDLSAGTGSDEPGGPETGEAAAAGADAAGSTESITEEPPKGKPGEYDRVEAAAEPGEAAGPGPQTEDDLEGEPGGAVDREVDDVTGEAPTDGALEDTGGDATAAGDPATSLSGIGPAYGERLAEAGVETVGDLRDADAAALADETGLSEKRVSRWIDRAGG